MDDLTRFRKEVDQFMALHPQSPLDFPQRAAFSGLRYYDADPAYRFVAPLERFPAGEPLIEMETSTGDVREYRRYGRFTFTVDGAEAALTIYSDRFGQEFFLPFKDATNGGETYGAGRYLDNHRPGLEVGRDGTVVVDFNYCYNPYCAYAEHYSCPLPPRENWVGVRIAAGEMDFAE